MNRIPILLGSVAVLLLASCSRGEVASPPAAATGATRASATNGHLPRLVFFMNPNGAPCQVQDRILREAESQLEGRVEVVRYSTTNPADRAMFARYGIRALPTLVVTDVEGNEITRSAPGIQSADQVLGLIGG